MALFRVATIVAVASAIAGCATAPPLQAGVTQLIENRSGQRGVWGVQITLHDSRFKPTIAPGELHLAEEKHGSDITEMMQWSTSDDGARLSIRFKPGMGDFGSGNTITVRVARSALVRYEQPNEPEWTISTDPT